jgi:hypothetical protein
MCLGWSDIYGPVESGHTGGIRVASSLNVVVPSSVNADFVEGSSKVGSGKVG